MECDRRCTFSASSKVVDTGVIYLICSSGENWTRGDVDVGLSVGWVGESISSVSGSGSWGDETESIVVLGKRDGRVRSAFRDARVLSAILARSSTRGMAVTPFTPYTAWLGSITVSKWF